MVAGSSVAAFLLSLVALSDLIDGSPVPEQLMDLSHPFDEDTLYWVTVKPFRFTKKVVNDSQEFFYAGNEFEAAEHGGTHIDAPYHFNKNGLKVDEIPVEKLFVQGIKIDAKNETVADSNYGLAASKLIEWEKRNGNITCPTVIIVDFGWAKKYNDKNDYFGSQTLQENDLNFPGISFEAAQWIANNEHVVGVGVDSASVDTGKNSVNPQSHVILTGAGKYMLENLSLDGVVLPEKGFELYITPMKIREGTGAPCRSWSFPYPPDFQLNVNSPRLERTCADFDRSFRHDCLVHTVLLPREYSCEECDRNLLT